MKYLLEDYLSAYYTSMSDPKSNWHNIAFPIHLIGAVVFVMSVISVAIIAIILFIVSSLFWFVPAVVYGVVRWVDGSKYFN